MNHKRKKKLIYSAKTPAEEEIEPKHKQNRNSLVTKCQPACDAVKELIHYCCALCVK